MRLTLSWTATIPHAWWTDEPQVGTGLDFGGELAGRCVRLQGKHCPGGDIGHNQRVRVLVVGERARRVTVKPERA